ncbi:MAG: hypothetical protein LBR13_01910, partial [Dysgonamonadaceae bacterium]|nr:hypothetical protein [Dysgonamonadaceae bacterium]
MEIKSIKRKNRRYCAGRLLICGLIGIQACFLFSCEDGLKNSNGASVSSKLRLNVSGIEAFSSLTRADLEPQTVVVTASDGALVEFTLSVDTAATTRSSSAMTAGKQYRVILFNKDFSKRTGSEADGPNKSFLCTAGTEAKLS